MRGTPIDCQNGLDQFHPSAFLVLRARKTRIEKTNSVHCFVTRFLPVLRLPSRSVFGESQSQKCTVSDTPPSQIFTAKSKLNWKRRKGQMLEISPWETLVKLLTDSLLNCTGTHEDVPHSKNFLRSLSTTYVASLAVATAVTVGTVCLAILHLVYISFYITHSNRRLLIVLLACTAPLVSILALVAMYMPRVWFLSHLLSFLYFSFALWVIICLLLHIFDGHHSLVQKMMQRLQFVEIATPPFCCLFPCLPKVRLEGRKIRWCELMVLQAPVVRLFATLISLVIYFEYQDQGLVPLKVLDFITLPSLLAGIYGTHMLVTTVSRMDELISYRYVVVFRLLDFFFMIFGLQQPVFDFLARYGAFGCGTVLPAIETSFYWKNFFTVMEAFCVTLISTVLLQPSKSSFFDKHPSCRSMSSARSTISTEVDTDESTT